MSEWTKYPPKVPGWYWLRTKSSLSAVEIDGDKLVSRGLGARFLLTTIYKRGWEWWPERIPTPPGATNG